MKMYWNASGGPKKQPNQLALESATLVVSPRNANRRKHTASERSNRDAVGPFLIVNIMRTNNYVPRNGTVVTSLLVKVRVTW